MAESELPVHVAVRYGGLTRCYPLNTERGDVVIKILGATASGHPRLRCGFDLSIEIERELEFGFEVGGRLYWLHDFRLQEAS